MMKQKNADVGRCYTVVNINPAAHQEHKRDNAATALIFRLVININTRDEKKKMLMSGESKVMIFILMTSNR